MRLIPISMCNPGMLLSKNVYSEEGVVLLAQNVELSSKLIGRLQEHGIDYLYIQDSRTDDLVVKEPIEEKTKVWALTEIRQTFRKLMEDSNRKSSITYYHLGKTFRSMMNSIIDDLSNHQDGMMMLTNMNVTDLYLYRHSLNVCIYTTMLGLSHGYDREQLMTLGLGALLHDVGKTQVPNEILTKPSQLTPVEMEEMKKHTTYGFQLLKDEPNIPLISAHCAFQHHERPNGSGYPRGLRANDIHEYALWIGMVDSYDAMTTHRVYRPALLPHHAIEILLGGVGTLYNKSMLELFRNKIAIYPIGMTVALSTGEVGVVVDLNSSYPQRPIVRILQDADKQMLHEPFEIDLSKKLSIVVTEVNPYLEVHN
jgi:HD-GYP domain-containing protein (c-di-GMP phosphodiesterase class II)